MVKRYYLSRALAVLCLAESNHLCNFRRRHHEEQFCEIILNLDQWFRRKLSCNYKNIDLKLYCIYS